MNYGIPYMGSKSRLVKDLIRIFPPAENFYDLFGGGFSVTHAMLLHRGSQYKNFYFNEIQSDIVQLIKDAINGKYSYNVFKPPFITSEEFHKRKDSDPYIRIIWSFGNNQRSYLFSKELETKKHSLHNAVIFNQFDDFAKRFFCFDSFQISDIKSRRLIVRKYARQRNEVELQRLEQLERLQRLQRLERLQRLAFFSSGYDEVEIKPNSIVYCDPPYKNTGEYVKQKFDSEKFYSWANAAKFPVFFSEFSAPDCFKTIWSKARVQKLKATERRRIFFDNVYANKPALEYIVEAKSRLKK